MDPLQLRFLGALVEELGRRMYPSATATIAELVSNAWDADAENVWVELPFGKPWDENSKITVVDDGNGMTRDEAQTRYLMVGGKRRAGGNDLSDRKKRKVHGRKGVGKLAAFGAADILRVTTKPKDGTITAFELDYEKIRQAPPGGDVTVLDIEAPTPPSGPDGKELAHGTRIELSHFKLTQPIPEERFIRSMARRFALAAGEMNVYVNDSALGRFAVITRFRFPPDALPEGVERDGDLAVELVGGKEVRWWMGFTPEPIKDDELRGVSIIARGKMAQRPFMFQRGRGVTSQLGQEYLVGEVIADWIDDDPDIEGDLIATNRSELMLEDSRLEDLLDWGRRRLDWALRKRQTLVEDLNVERLELSAELQRRLANFTKPEQRTFTGIGSRLASLPETTPEQVEQLMLELIDGHSDKAVRSMMDAINSTDAAQQDVIWPLVAEFGLIDARRLKSIIEARLAVIGKLRELVQGGAKEIPDIHQHVRNHYWLIDPRWNLLDDEVVLTKLLDEQFGLNEPDAEGMRMDFVYCLGPKTPAVKDVVFLVEIKRGTFPDGKPRRVTTDEINRFHEYYVFLTGHLRRLVSNPPPVRGIMIASDYQEKAVAVKGSFEKLGLEFTSWDAVLENTERLHIGWLELSEYRSQDVPTAVKE